MKKHIALVGSILLFAFSVCGQTDTASRSNVDTILQRIVLIGDAGQLTNGRHPVVSAVKQLVKLDKKTTVVYLGDNLYKTGLPDSQATTYRAMKSILDSQISVVEKTDARVVMIPGNHDWHNGSRTGWEAVMREQLYVTFLNQKNVEFQPQDGCPGPVEISLGNEVTLIVFDSQWWLHPHDKPEIESDCPQKTQEELLIQIEEIASRNSRKLVLLACHHPFKTNGTHGGYYTFKQHLFPFTDWRKNLYIPLPLIGSIYPLSRSVFGTPQDLKHPTYQNMVNEVSERVKNIPNLIFVAGHDHNLQHIVDSNRHYIVSGGGCKINRTSPAKNSRYNNTNTGFAVMEVSVNKNVTLDFYQVSDTSTKKDYTGYLLNFSTIPEEKIDSNALKVDDPFLKYKDTTTQPASDDFPPIGGLKRTFMGENYRKEWSTPVNMKVFNLRKEGFTIKGLGGSTQTKSLRLVDAKGKEWVLRSVQRTPSRVIPESFRGNLAQELRTASHPYGALTFPILAEAIDISVAHPKLFFVPSDPALGFHRPLFENQVCLLEEADATWDGKKSNSTAKVLDKMLDENDHRPATYMILQSRFLDMMTGDFDRHLDQWRWGTIDTGKGKIYYPIPRDRDQAYFYSDGLLIRAASSRTLPYLKGFRFDISRPEWLGYISRDFDRIFLTDLDVVEWKDRMEDFKQRMTDSIIRLSVQQLPPEIFAINGETMIKKLIHRRNVLDKAAMEYYEFLAKRVNVMGSNQKEYFKVNNSDDGGLHVTVYGRTKGNDTSFIMYDRVFQAPVTREIHLYGLNDDDYFDIEENTKSKIKIRIIGGRGNDTFDIRGSVENLIYDLTTENNLIKDSSFTKNRFEDDTPVNERSIMGFNYNVTRYPRFHINYNSDDGLMIGAGVSRRTFGFRNLPYASDQRLQLFYAIDRKAFQLNYTGLFNHITRKLDLMVKANISQPAFRNFTGLGNETRIADGRNIRYYLGRYRFTEFEILARKRYFENAHLMVGPYFYHYNAKHSDNIGTAFGDPHTVGLDSGDIYRKKNYAGVKLAFLVDNRNREFNPTRGVHWLTEITGLTGITNGSTPYIRYTTDMVLYASLREPAGTVFIAKWGGGRIYTNNYEWFQSLSLGANNDLNGFRKTRYNGRSLLYASLETKIKLFDVNSYILPGPFGVSAFIDAGRVWHKNEKSGKWHLAVGGGVYYLPFEQVSFSATAGFSKGEKMFIFNLGTRVNLIW